MLARLKIGPKLLLAPAAVLVLLILSSSVAYYAMVRQNQAFETIVHERAARIRDATELVAEVRQVHAGAYQLLTWLGASFAEQRVAALERDIVRRNGGIGARFAALAQASRGSARELALLQRSRAAYLHYRQSVLDVLELSRADYSMSANAMSKAERSFDQVEAALGELAALEQHLSEQASNRAQADFLALSVWMPVMVALSVVVSLLITMVVRRALLAEVAGIGQAASDLGRGDLTVARRAYGRDEIADTSRALDTSIRNLNTSLKSIRASARAIDSASRDSAEAAGRLAELPAAPVGAVLTRVKARSRRVTDLAGVLGKLATQANLLALNAAAERGEHELAQRMRDLALRSAAAAGEIGELAAQSIAEVEAGGVARMKVATAASDPVVTPFEKMSRDSCALVQEAAAAARGLQDQALALSKAVSIFKLDDTAPAMGPQQALDGVREELEGAGARPVAAAEGAVPTPEMLDGPDIPPINRSHLKLASTNV